MIAVAHFSCYLFGTLFTLVTDHQPLKWLMESDKLTQKLARWALVLEEYDFQVVHRPGVANLDTDGLSWKSCTSQEDDTRGRWHGEADEEIVIGWHASAFMCLLREYFSRENHLTSCSSQRLDGQSLDPEVEDGATDQLDIHDDALVLEILQISMVPGTMGSKEQDCVLHRAKGY